MAGFKRVAKYDLSARYWETCRPAEFSLRPASARRSDSFEFGQRHFQTTRRLGVRRGERTGSEDLGQRLLYWLDDSKSLIHREAPSRPFGAEGLPKILTSENELVCRVTNPLVMICKSHCLRAGIHNVCMGSSDPHRDALPPSIRKVREDDSLWCIPSRQQQTTRATRLIPIQEHQRWPLKPVLSNHLAQGQPDGSGAERHHTGSPDGFRVVSYEDLPQHLSSTVVLDVQVALGMLVLVHLGQCKEGADTSDYLAPFDAAQYVEARFWR